MRVRVRNLSILGIERKSFFSQCQLGVVVSGAEIHKHGYCYNGMFTFHISLELLIPGLGE